MAHIDIQRKPKFTWLWVALVLAAILLVWFAAAIFKDADQGSYRSEIPEGPPVIKELVNYHANEDLRGKSGEFLF